MAAKFRAVIRRPDEWDAFRLARDLRQRDRDEVWASAGPDVEGAIANAVQASGDLCWSVCNGADFDRLVWVIGCAPVALGIGSPWLLATDDVQLCPGTLTKLTKAHIAEMLKVYPRLVNMVDARNGDSVRWLARLGFVIEPAVPYGVAGLPFHRFTMGF